MTNEMFSPDRPDDRLKKKVGADLAIPAVHRREMCNILASDLDWLAVETSQYTHNTNTAAAKRLVQNVVDLHYGRKFRSNIIVFMYIDAIRHCKYYFLLARARLFVELFLDYSAQRNEKVTFNGRIVSISASSNFSLCILNN